MGEEKGKGGGRLRSIRMDDLGMAVQLALSYVCLVSKSCASCWTQGRKHVFEGRLDDGREEGEIWESLPHGCGSPPKDPRRRDLPELSLFASRARV